MFNVERFATHVELVAPRWLTFFAGESVGELAVVVREQLDGSHWRRVLQTAQAVHAAVFALIGVNAHKHPACGAVNGNEQVPPLTLVGHLRPNT